MVNFMLRETRHNMLIVWLGLMLVFAPFQSALSAVSMLDHTTGSSPHCQMMSMADHAGMAGMDDMDHGSCCQHDGACQDNCSNCSHCFTVAAVLVNSDTGNNDYNNSYNSLSTLRYRGVSPGGEFRPPRSTV
ncbi:MAG: hypothetical protein OEZ39_12025 [Gammaproteobacteria bacterium]|nr:hypothetical protein [Gammaproteobacteria bacterium]